MAELLIIPRTKGPDPHYQDGDIVECRSDLRIHCCHAEHICLPRDVAGKRPINEHGICLDPDGLGVAVYQEFGYTMFERISRTEVRRTRTDGTVDIIDGVPRPTGPHGRMEHMHVEQYVARRLAHARKVSGRGGGDTFGSRGQEVWFGGSRSVTRPAVDRVWNAIETKTPKRKSTHGQWPMGLVEKQVLLGLTVDDMTEAESQVMTAGEDAETERLDIIIEAVDSPVSVPAGLGEQYVEYAVRLSQRVPPGASFSSAVVSPGSKRSYRVKRVLSANRLLLGTRGPGFEGDMAIVAPAVGPAVLKVPHGRKRVQRVPYDALPLGVPAAVIRDRVTPVEVRHLAQARAAIVQAKG